MICTRCGRTFFEVIPYRCPCGIRLATGDAPTELVTQVMPGTRSGATVIDCGNDYLPGSPWFVQGEHTTNPTAPYPWFDEGAIGDPPPPPEEVLQDARLAGCLRYRVVTLFAMSAMLLLVFELLRWHPWNVPGRPTLGPIHDAPPSSVNVSIPTLSNRSPYPAVTQFALIVPPAPVAASHPAKNAAPPAPKRDSAHRHATKVTHDKHEGDGYADRLPKGATDHHDP